MTENTKKWLTVAGCLVVLRQSWVAVIASSFSKRTRSLMTWLSAQQLQAGRCSGGRTASPWPPAESPGMTRSRGDNVTVNPETPDASTNTDDGTALILPAPEQTILSDQVKLETIRGRN